MENETSESSRGNRMIARPHSRCWAAAAACLVNCCTLISPVPATEPQADSAACCGAQVSAVAIAAAEAPAAGVTRRPRLKPEDLLQLRLPDVRVTSAEHFNADESGKGP